MAISKKIDRWFNVHADEFGLFLWTVALLFLVRSSGVFLNNYAEMAFLKRYGVEYMPIVNMANAVATFFVMGIITGLMTRLPGTRLLIRLFLFCGASVAVIRAIVPLGIDLIYPTLFMLKSQYEVLQALLFWNLANDLFNTRQSKRLFPLITAGGVIGQILGSFATPVVVRWLHIDNLLIIYMLTTLSGAWVVKAMARRYPSALFRQKNDEKEDGRESIIDEIKTVLPLMRSSVLLKILVALTFLPNVLITIMNYQFNYAINEQFGTETGLIEFFGYFRGVLNIISLMILLFVGKLYDRFGLPVALMFHPFNYMLVFLTFLLRFDGIAAVYARMSSNIIRTTINIPAKAVVTGMFPESYRDMVRPFLKSTVVRIGLILGSSLILFSEPLFHPRYLSIVAMPFALAWVVVPFIFKRRYTGILMDLLDNETINIGAMSNDDLKQLFRDQSVHKELIQRFSSASREGRLWLGQFLRKVDAEDLDDHLLEAINEEQDTTIRIGLIELLSERSGPAVLETFWKLVATETPALAAAMIEAGHRMSPEIFAPFNRHIYERTSMPFEVKARAVGSLYSVDQKKYGTIIDAWLTSEEKDLREAGLIAIGVSRDRRFVGRLKSLLPASVNDDDMLTLVLENLQAIGATHLNPLVKKHLEHPTTGLRRAALSIYEITDESSLEQVVSMLDDDSSDIVQLAEEKIKAADYQDNQVLIKSLSHPRKKVKEALLKLLATMSIKDIDVFRFVQIQTRACYQLLLQARQVKDFFSGDKQRLLSTHLEEQMQFVLHTTLRVLGTQDPTGRMRKIVRGILSGSKRQRANGIEAMEQILDKQFIRLLTPFLEDMPVDGRIAAGRRLFPSNADQSSETTLLESLMESKNWVTLTLVLSLMEETAELAKPLEGNVKTLGKHPHPEVVKSAQVLLAKRKVSQTDRQKNTGTVSVTLIDKLLHLEQMELFGGLPIYELATLASMTDVLSLKDRETVFHEGDRGDALYLVLAGNVSVIKNCDTDKEIHLDSTGAGEAFGEMALFGNNVRSATIRVKQSAQILRMRERQFRDIVLQNPHVGLHVARVLSMRIRRLQDKISALSC